MIAQPTTSGIEELETNGEFERATKLEPFPTVN